MGSVMFLGPASFGFLSSKREGNKRRSKKTPRTKIKKMIDCALDLELGTREICFIIYLQI